MQHARGAAPGAYAREFFVSQTPEVTAMIGVVIDVAGRARSREGRSDNGRAIRAVDWW